MTCNVVWFQFFYIIFLANSNKLLNVNNNVYIWFNFESYLLSGCGMVGQFSDQKIFWDMYPTKVDILRS